MSITRKTTEKTTQKPHLKALAGLAGAAALTAGVLASGVPAAHAAASDTDRPKATEQHFDFGKNWTVNAPRNGGYAYWNLSNGVTSIDVEGYLYLTNNECGRLRVEYYNDSHALLASQNAPRRCANGTAKKQWWESLSYSSTTVSHIHVVVQEEKSNGTFAEVDHDYETFD